MAASTSKLRGSVCWGIRAMVASVLVLGGSACKKDDGNKHPAENPDDPAVLAEDGAESAVTEVDAEVVTSSLVSATASSGSLTLASTTSELAPGGIGTAGLGDGAKALYFPRNCLTVTSDAPTNTVTYDFVGCTGPNGIFKISGIIKATYTTSPNKLVLNLVGTGLQMNRATVDWSASAEITSNGLERSMHWKGQLAGVTAKGREFTRTNEKVVTWHFGERCFGVSGVSEGNVRGRFLRTAIANFRRCQGGCPEAGGRITISNLAKLEVEIDYDGTRHATLKSPKGTSIIDLACTP